MTLREFGTLLESVVPNIGHFKAKRRGFPRIVYGETERLYFCTDNKPTFKRWKVEVRFFTREDFDPTVEQLEDLFVAHNIPFDLVAVEYGAIPIDGKTFDEGVIYYLFECEV